MAILRTFGATNVGRKRKHNEDNFLIDNDLKLFIVADGMGGHNAGEVASEMAIKVIRREILAQKELLRKAIQDDLEGNQEEPKEAILILENAIQTACYEVFHQAQQNESKKGMGTTVVVVLVVGDKGLVAHVGDSRVYLVRKGHLHQLTEDHSMVQEQLRQGKITKEEAENSPYKNVITRAVGIYEYVPPDIIFLELAKGDRFLLCSDGVHPYFKEKELLSHLATQEPLNTIVENIVQTVLNGGAHDNLTAVVVEVAEISQQNIQMEVSGKLDILKKIPVFQYLTYNELVKAYSIISTRKYQKGELIIKENDIGQDFFILFKGKVAVLKGDIQVAELFPGSNFGEMGLVDNAPRSASIKALETCYLMVVERAKFFELMKKEPQIAVKLLWSLLKVFSARLRATTNELSQAKMDKDKAEEVELFIEEE
ncbi:Stp1/IreP family PP2C-type Ser/Thr phosphatase [bacterium]|nr:Stp1/IreP family PP2C-type Ser/Thr phosphatase [bacterium]